MAQVAAGGLTPNHPVKYTIENPNCMNRIVQWFRNDETSTVLKVGVLVLAGLALIGAGFLAGQPLVSLLGALPLALWAWREWGVLNKNIEEEAQKGSMTPEQAFMRVENSNATTFEKMQRAAGGQAAYNQFPVLNPDDHPPKDYIVVNSDDHPPKDYTFVQKNHPQYTLAHEEELIAAEPLAIIQDSTKATTFQKMQAAVGGAAAYNQLPVLEVDQKLFSMRYPHNGRSLDRFDWLKPEDLASPVMKGVWSAQIVGEVVWTGRLPFIAMKIKDRGVLTFFQKNSDDPNVWNYGPVKKFPEFSRVRLEKIDIDIIHRIVVERNHPTITLAE